MFYVLSSLCASLRHFMYVDVYHLCVYEIRVNASNKKKIIRYCSDFFFPFLAFPLSVCRFDSNFKDPFQRPSKIPAAGVKHIILNLLKNKKIFLYIYYAQDTPNNYFYITKEIKGIEKIVKKQERNSAR